jgi:hypothetical protein
MLKYREKAHIPNEVSYFSETLPSAKDVPAYMSLAAQYGIDNDMDFGNSGQDEQQTIDQEYQAYVTASCSPKGTDILKFWEVGVSYIMCSNITDEAS